MNNVTTEGAIDLSKKRRVPMNSKNLPDCLLMPGDVLFNATNSPELVGKSAYFAGLNEAATFSNHFLRLRPTADIDGRYLARWLTWQQQRKTFMGLCRRWVNQASVSREALLDLSVPLPPLSAQHRIAEILDAVDGILAKRRAAIAQLDSLTQSILVDMFGSLTANPNRYPIATMIELVDPHRPITYGILKPGDDVPDGVPYVRVVDMTDRSINGAGLRRTSQTISSQYKRSLLKEGDLLLSIRGHVGRLAIVESDVAGANITQDTARLAITGADPIYVLECLRSPALQFWMKTFTKGAAVRGINLTDVKRIQLPIPPVPDQHTFANAAGEVERIRNTLLRSAGHLATLFASVQHRAFRGEL